MTRHAATSSLRARLLGGTLAVVAIIWIALSLTAWREAVHEAEELFDAHLTQTASLLAGMARHDMKEIAMEDAEAPSRHDRHIPQAHRYSRKVIFQIWAVDGRLLMQSGNAPPRRLSPGEKDFSDVVIDGRDWRVHSLRDEARGLVIQVAEAADARRAVGRELATHLLAPLVIALPLLALALMMLIGRNLAPLTRLADSIAQRSPQRLDAIPLADVPRELHPVIGRLNGLLDQLARSLDQERRFTADAAHELRTPLAAIRAHAQVARSSHDDAERGRALDCVIEATDRTAHLVEQLLTLTRLDAASLAGQFSSCDLRQIAVDVLAHEAPHAFAKEIDLSLAEGPPLRVRGDATLLSILLRNLIDNAIRYSPKGAQISVAVRTASENGGDVLLEVADEGPGIPPEKRQHVMERFTRLAENQESGSGLGLSIVARIVELHDARFAFDNGPDGRGLLVRIAFARTHETEISAS